MASGSPVVATTPACSAHTHLKGDLLILKHIIKKEGNTVISKKRLRVYRTPSPAVNLPPLKAASQSSGMKAIHLKGQGFPLNMRYGIYISECTGEPPTQEALFDMIYSEVCIFILGVAPL